MDEWRVEVDLDDEHHGFGLGERLRSLELDDEARERLGDRVIVTRDGPRLFLYSGDEPGAREAERVVRELAGQDGLSAELAVTRWHPDEEAWRPADEPLPQTDAERDAERGRASAENWEARVQFAHLGDALALERELADAGLPVERRFTYLLVGAATEEEARRLVERLRTQAGPSAEVSVEPNLEGVPDPRFVWFGDHKPGIARDLGL